MAIIGLPTAKRNPWASIGQGFGEGLFKQIDKNQRTAEFEKAFPQYKGIPEEYREMAVKAELEKQLQSQKLAGGKQELDQNIQDIANAYKVDPNNLKGAKTTSEAIRIAKDLIKEKGPLGGLGGKPLSEEETSAIEEVLRENPDAEPEELELAFAKKGISPGRSKPYTEARGKSEEIRQKKYESEREFHTKVSADVVKNAQKVVNEAPIKKGLIAQQRRDIASGQTAGLIPWLVEQTGIETYRNPESARFKTVSKDRFVANLSSIAGAARPNQFIEQQLVSAQPALGRDEEANQTVLDLEEFIEDLKEQRARYELQMAEEDFEKYGYERRDIAQRADKLMKPYAEQRQEEMAYTIRKRHEDTLDTAELAKDITLGNVPRGTPLTVRSARILMIMANYDEKKAQAMAKKMGFEIPNEKTYMLEAK